MVQKDSQSGKLSRTERDIDFLLRQTPHPAEPMPGEPARREAYRVMFVVLCVVADAILVPWTLSVLFGWAWVFVAPLILVCLVYLEYKTYGMAFPARHSARHFPSDHIPQFRSADSDGEMDTESSEQTQPKPR